MSDTGAAHAARIRIVVIGGGFTGAVFVCHAIRSTSIPLHITVIEPAAELGRGTAYGTSDPAHRINVPSSRMGILADDPAAATRWLFAQGLLPDPESDDGEGQFYVPRQAYDAFVSAQLRDAVAGARGRVAFRHLRARATGIARRAESWRVTTDVAVELDAAIVVLCFGHAAPTPPCTISQDVAASSKFVPNPWVPNAMARIDPTDSVLIVGTGLTMADVVMSLLASGRGGSITAISRRGLLPRGHGRFAVDFDLFQGQPVPRTALGLLLLLRKRIRESDPSLGWHPIIDALRGQLPMVWSAMPAAEQRRVLRRLLPFWDVHRFRIAPQVSAMLTKAQANGGLSVEKAGLTSLSYRDGQYAAGLRYRYGRTEERIFDAVVLCTGPDKNLAAHPLIAPLLADGTVHLDQTGTGLAVDPSSRAIDVQVKPNPTLLAFGPMTRGSFGEMTGAPDIARQIEKIAGELLG